jgi:adenine/guanine/hypoxanthine permease|uniref:NCS2 family permease n=1 Tax=Candidatus Planktophila sp. TaxID=2175601 RepID=UPI004049F0C9
MLDSFFKISERGSTISREVRGGVVTFFTMAYIVVLNPIILGGATDVNGDFLGGEGGMAKIAAATALVAGIMTLLMGVVANFPLAIATGLGLNTFVAYAIASQMTWADAMGLVVLEGLIILILVLTGFRTAVFRAVPAQLKVAISVGIGLFIALIGLVDAGFVRRTNVGPVPVTLGDGKSLIGWPIIVFIVGFFLMIVLMVKKVKGALLIGIAVATILSIIIERTFKVGTNYIPGAFTADGKDFINPKGWGLNVPAIPSEVVATPNFDLLGQFNLFGSFSKIGFIAAALLVFTLLLADFFDTMGTMTAIGHEAKLIDKDGDVPNASRILLVDSVAAAAGGAAGVSSNTSYIESASGVGEGARTGLASVVTGVLFLLTTVLSPLVNVIPYEAATPALIIVGFLMMSQIKNIDWDDMGIAVPAFLTIILMPFTYNITVGIGAGFITYVVIRVVQGRGKEIHALLWLIAALFMVYFLSSPINTWVG